MANSLLKVGCSIRINRILNNRIMRTNRNFPGLMVNVPKMMNHLMNDDFTNQFSEFVKDFNAPSYNVKENEDSYTVELAVPGFDKQDFSIKIHEGKLVVSSEVETNAEEKKNEYSYREFHKSSFSRTFALPKNKIDEDKVEATYLNGVLEIALAKKEEAKPKSPQLVEVK